MKRTMNKIWLLWLCLMLSFLFIKYVSAADEPTERITITPNLAETVLHRSHLHTLHLWAWNKSGTLVVTEGKTVLSNWLIVWNNAGVGGNTSFAVIGWGKNNTVKDNSNYAGIGWGINNRANADFSFVGWGKSNESNWVNSVILGWSENKAEAWGVVVGWSGNQSLNGWVVLWWYKNLVTNINGLVFGKNSRWGEGSFAWNGAAGANSGYIGASGWILIWTTTPIDWVNLVVKGAVQLWNRNEAPVKWEIRYVWWCFYSFDGDKWHVLNRWNEKNETDDVSSNDECYAPFAAATIAKYCEFWNTVIWDNDKVTAYTKPNGVTCTSMTLTCRGGKLYNASNAVVTEYYPYCYTIHKD